MFGFYIKESPSRAILDAISRVQNAPYPTLHEYSFREASRGLERKLSHIIWRCPSFQFLLTRYVCCSVMQLKNPVRGRLGEVLCTKSHRSHEHRMCKRAWWEILFDAKLDLIFTCVSYVPLWFQIARPWGRRAVSLGILSLKCHPSPRPPRKTSELRTW